MATTEVSLGGLAFALVDWRHHHHDISDTFVQVLAASVRTYQRKSVMVKRDRWILTGYDGRTIDVTTAKAWVDLYEKKQVDFSDLYDTDLAKRVIPRYKPVRDDTLFLEKISGATKQTKYESEPQWIFPAPHVDRQKVPTGLAVFVYLPTSRELVASIDAVYHSDRTVYVENVNTRLDYRGNGLCKIMFTTLVTYLYKTGRARHIRLFNATGDIGCKCYVKGAEAGGATNCPLLAAKCYRRSSTFILGLASQNRRLPTTYRD